MSTVLDPVVPAGVVPIDLTAWRTRLARREHKPKELDPVIQNDPQGDEVEWLEWHLKNTEQPVMTNDELRTLAVAKRKKIAPGTIEQHDAFTNEHDRKEHGEIIRAYRQFAIFRLWADGSETGPALPAISIDKMKWLAGQTTLPKYLKWYRTEDPEGFAKWLESHPSYRPQAGLPPLPTVTGPTLAIQEEGVAA